jgi:DNA-binding NarL/FixJ family response regulator
MAHIPDTWARTPDGPVENTDAMMTRILIVDDHPLFREALESAVRMERPQCEIFEATTIDEALSVLSKEKNIDLGLFDLFLPGTSGLSGLVRVRAAHPHLPIMVVSGHEDPRIVRDMLSIGVAGFVSKATSKSELAHAIREVLNGSIFLPERFRDLGQPQPSEIERRDMLRRLQDLTPQQLRVLDMIRAGLQNKQIAYELSVAETTVKAHVSEILRKLNVYSRTKAAIEVGKMDFAQFSASDQSSGDQTGGIKGSS